MAVTIEPTVLLAGLSAKTDAKAIASSVLANANTLMEPETALARISILDPVIQPLGISQRDRIRGDIGIRVDATFQPDRIGLNISPGARVVISIVVVDLIAAFVIDAGGDHRMN